MIPSAHISAPAILVKIAIRSTVSHDQYWAARRNLRPRIGDVVLWKPWDTRLYISEVTHATSFYKILWATIGAR